MQEFAVKLDEEPPPAKKPCIEKQKPKRKLPLQKESTKAIHLKVKETLILTVFILVQKVVLSIPHGLILDFSLLMKTGNDKHVTFWAWNLEVLLTMVMTGDDIIQYS